MCEKEKAQGSWKPRGLYWLAQLLMLTVIPKDQGPCGLEPNPDWGWEKGWGSSLGSPLFVFSGCAEKCRVPTCSPLQESGLPLPASPETSQSRGHVKSALLQVVLCDLITVLIFISSSSPFLPSPQMLCFPRRHSVRDGGRLIIN